jgi:hypothetical protein
MKTLSLLLTTATLWRCTVLGLPGEVPFYADDENPSDAMDAAEMKCIQEFDSCVDSTCQMVFSAEAL